MTSIIIITYNRAAMLKQAIQSVLEQTVQDWELIIVDDGSDDGTEEFITSLKDDRIRYIKKGHSGNLSYLRNIGMQQAKGAFIAFLDSDDIWKSTKLEEQLDTLKENCEAEYCFCDIQVIENEIIRHDGSFHLKEKLSYGNFGKAYLQDKLTLFPSALLIKKDCLQQTGLFDEQLKAGDHDFMARLMLLFNGVLLSKPLVIIHRHIKNHSDEDKLKPVESYLYTLKKCKQQKLINGSFYQTCRSLILNKKGFYLKINNNKGASRLAFLESFIAWPLNIKSLYQFLRG